MDIARDSYSRKKYGLQHSINKANLPSLAFLRFIFIVGAAKGADHKLGYQVLEREIYAGIKILDTFYAPQTQKVRLQIKRVISIGYLKGKVFYDWRLPHIILITEPCSFRWW